MKLNQTRSIALAPLLVLILVTQACAVNFARDLRLTLAASGPLVESLNLGDNRVAVVADFTDLASGAASLADDFTACAGDKACKLSAVARFEALFESVQARGHMGLHPKLQRIEQILRRIVTSAKIYYGGATMNAQSLPQTQDVEKQLKAALKSLKEAMQP